MDRATAVRLYKMVNQGEPVGVAEDGEIIYAPTPLGEALILLGKPVCFSSQTLDKPVMRVNAAGYTYPCRTVENTARVAAFLREWADALEGPHADV